MRESCGFFLRLLVTSQSHSHVSVCTKITRYFLCIVPQISNVYILITKHVADIKYPQVPNTHSHDQVRCELSQFPPEMLHNTSHSLRYKFQGPCNSYKRNICFQSWCNPLNYDLLHISNIVGRPRRFLGEDARGRPVLAGDCDRLLPTNIEELSMIHMVIRRGRRIT